MFRSTLVLSAIVTVVLQACVSGLPTARGDSPLSVEQLDFFEKQVRPLLAQHCYSCHSAGSKKLQAGLRVDYRSGLIDGGDSGQAIVPGDPAASLFMEALHYESYEMPPKGKLADDEIAVFEQWIRNGAPWPEEDVPEASGDDRAKFNLEGRKQEHWVWQPIQSPSPPMVKDASWPRAELDHFVLAKLDDNALVPSPDADRAAILRRLYLDLIGLPPSPQQTAEFLADDSAMATENLVDRLLQSPRFGERWGRHWLDLVRYAESRGHEFDNDSTNAYQYRDYIIRAFNADVPYDQLIREHIAGDLVSPPRLNPEQGFNESILGTGFWFLGEWVHSPVDILKDESDRFDNMVDVMSKAFLGVTVSCARCHDHKFDAISTADYYSLTGFLQSSDFRQVRFESMESNRRVASQLSKVDASYRDQVSQWLLDHGHAQSQATPLPEEISSRLVVDYQNLADDQFLQDGFIFGDAPRRFGDAWLDESGDQPVIRLAAQGQAGNDAIWDGLETLSEKGQENRGKLHRLPRAGRTLRTPTFALNAGRVLCRVQGEGHVVACVDSHRLIAGPLHGQTVQSITSKSPWVELDLSRYIGHRLHLEFTPAQNSRLQVAWVMQGDQTQVAAAKAALGDSVADQPDPSLVDLAKSSDPWQSLAAEWAQKRADLKGQIVKRSHAAMAMMNGTGEDAHVLIRGNSSSPGDLEPRHFLTAIAGDAPMPIESGSGRLELAEQINDPANPLTSRVIVNRIWHHLIGRGIVPTTDDFGVLGQRPTHPELLDHLATRFTTGGQSIKQMIRYIVLSRTYQMSSKPDAQAVAADPKNLLWHHRSPKRLEGEAIRDSLLTLSGEIDLTSFGESVPIHLTSFMDGRGRPKRNGPLDGNGRRSIYIAVRRNFLSPFMLTFDTPVPFSSMGRRNVSNVPAQSLILMNDPFVVQQASGWAQRAQQNADTLPQRVRWLYLSAFARQPTQPELAAAIAYLDSPQDQPDIGRWADLAHALINTKEFIFLR
ncbi:Planctomycete cytochrome C [Rubripirellula lacrimiformis]|uniref:Planctomycete cytochrome C n=1 Tax=Rubripirellula lacrimiformis TaxID=1930273 RepID=A0A517N4C2_9BACT|nr:PSD1 and planctomycete cytochrome C domain-containing protein [Rubripirellula lacrimiformis]QDT01990.1 Planctomycete cytochrome C [Rubripirellula lacrimiformis]